MNKRELIDQEYAHAFCEDIPPSEESALGIEIRNNPKIVASSVMLKETNHSSVIFQAIYIGSFGMCQRI